MDLQTQGGRLIWVVPRKHRSSRACSDSKSDAKVGFGTHRKFSAENLETATNGESASIKSFSAENTHPSDAAFGAVEHRMDPRPPLRAPGPMFLRAQSLRLDSGWPLRKRREALTVVRRRPSEKDRVVPPGTGGRLVFPCHKQSPQVVYRRETLKSRPQRRAIAVA